MSVVHVISENRLFRFLVMGALNTIATFGIYIALGTIFNYQIAYFLAYASGIVIAYFMNSLFVFRNHVSFQTFIRFPIVYVVQYIAGAGLLELMVHRLGLSVTFAPLFVIALTLPLTFLLTRFVLSKY